MIYRKVKSMKLTQKRGLLCREWILSTLACNECYYRDTIQNGIPDGNSIDTVVKDLADGKYDDCINGMLLIYKRAKQSYGEDGYRIQRNGKVTYDENEAIRETELIIPGFIRKGVKYKIPRLDDQWRIKILFRDGYPGIANRIEELIEENAKLKERLRSVEP